MSKAQGHLTIRRRAKDGSNGKDGADGKDAISIIVTTNTLVWDLSQSRQIIGIDMYEGDKSIPYGDGNNGFISDTVTPPVGLRCTYDYNRRFGDHTFNYVYIKDENAIINTEIPYAITYKGKTYPYIVKMQTVENGLDGCIQRLTDWHEGVEYHNDTNLKAPIRFLDSCIVYNEDRTVMQYYVCRKTHVATALNKPIIGSPDTAAWRQFWTEVNETAPIYTPLIISDYAMLRFTQTNQLLVMDNDKSIIAGMGGGDYPLWVGGASPEDENTKTRISKDGTLEAERGLFRGFVKRKMTEITYENIAEYAKIVETAPSGAKTYQIDFTKAGMFVKFGEGKTPETTCHLRGYAFYGYIKNKAHNITLEEAMEFIGCSVVIYMADYSCHPTLVGDIRYTGTSSEAGSGGIPYEKNWDYEYIGDRGNVVLRARTAYVMTCEFDKETSGDIIWHCQEIKRVM